MKYPLDKLDNYFLNYNKITEDMEYEIFDIYAKDMITVNRIDLVVKYYYIECREKNQDLDFAKELYKKHIEAFTDGTFSEQGNSNKNSLEKYIEVFDNLIDDFKVNGYSSDISIIPIGKNYELLDGSHRTACAAYFNQKIKVIRFPNLSVDYGFEFFKWRLLDDFYLDFIANKFAMLKDNIYILIAWPQIAGSNNIKVIDEILEKNQCKVIYRKRLKFNREGLWNLIFQIYKDEPWIGHNKSNFKGITVKTDLCYDKSGCVEIYILNCPYLQSLSMAKDEIRESFGIGKSSIHTSDTKKETTEILNFIFDKNYDEILYNSFQLNRSLKHSWIKYFGRKIRNKYRVSINNIKSILSKPV
ncbi:MAG: hypothetical protein N2B06_16505 [Clostridium sp.]